MKKNKKINFIEDLKHDIQTLKTLSFKSKCNFIYDYYKYRILVVLFCIATFFTIVSMVKEGTKKYDLHVCAVLNTEEDCSDWFSDFSQQKQLDINLNTEQPFDYTNPYYSIYEVEVLTKISSNLMDVAICNKDMYTYLLAINACTPFDTILDAEQIQQFNNKKLLVHDIANLQEDEKGKIDQSVGIEGDFALLLDQTTFGQKYDADEENKPLYLVVIKNTKHLENCISLVKDITK